MLLETALFIVTFIFILWLLTKPDPYIQQFGDKIPGPYAYPILGNITNVPANGEEQIKKWAEVFEKYGDVWRAWVGNRLYVVIRDPDDMEAILGSTKNLTKSSIYDMLHDWLGTGLLTSAGEKWQKRRKAITPAFHFKIIENFVETFNKQSSVFIDVMKNYSSTVINIYPFISNCTLDIVSETSMGVEMNAQTEKSDYVSAVRRLSRLLSERFRKPWLHPNILYRILRSPAEVTKLIKELQEHTLRIIQEKKKALENEKEEISVEKANELGIKKKQPFLELLLKLQDKRTTFETDDDIREEVDTFMFEGHDTTASALSFMVMLLSKNQKVQQTLYEELSESINNKNSPSYEQLQELRYLDMVVKECLRLYPPVPTIGRNITEEIQLPSGYFLPAGSVVLLTFYHLHRIAKNFPNPLKFNPENFLPDVAAKRHPFAYLPFSAGSRNCIGQKFAMTELKSFLAKLVLNFKIEDGGFELRPETDMVLQNVDGHNVVLKDRTCTVNKCVQ